MNNYKGLLDRHHKYLRYLLLLSFTTFVILFVATTAHGAWYDGNWLYRKQITIKSSEVTGGPHSNFPVLISRTTDTELAASARNDGYDILFTSSDEVTKIAHEIEKFDGTTGELVAWVKVGSLSSASNTVIYMYYGNPAATDQQQVSPVATEVWDSSYVGVWHLNETTGSHYDSTSGNNGTPGGGVIQDAIGKIDGADDFDGNDDYVEIGTTGFSATNMTFTAWVRLDALADHRYIFGHTTQPAFANRIQLYTSGTSPTVLGLGLGDTHAKDTGSILSAGPWYHVALVKEATNYWVYLNTALDMSGTYTGLSALQTYADIGNDGNPFERTESWNGLIEEVRISNIVRSADWIATEYNNQNNSANFIIVGSQWGSGSGNLPPNVDAGNNKIITLPDTDVALSDATASDPDSGPSSLITTWTQVSGPATVTFAPDVNALNPTVSGLTLEGDYVLKLSAYDGADTSEDTVTITVNPTGSVDVSGYSCSMKITIQGSQVQGGPHNDFPVLISLTDESLKTSGCGFVTSDYGYDILFTNSSMSSQLDHEIEKYDKETGELLAWVKMDLNAYPNDTEIYMYYGKSGAGDQQNPTGVWDSSIYEAVYHLQDDSLVDSTSNNHDSTGDDTQPIDGRILGGQDFSPQDEIAVGNWSVSGQELTLQAWANFHDFDQDDPRVISKAGGTGSEGHVFMLGLGGWNDQHLRMRVKTGTSDFSGTTTMADSDNSPTYPLSADTWYLIAGTYDGSYMRLYRNGVQVESIGKSGNIRVNSWNIALGNHPGNTNAYYTSMDGWLDEVRIVKKARSSDWLMTEFNNQNDPSSFYSVEKNCPETTPPIAEFSCSIPITIDPSKVSGTSDLVNFPVLISLTNTSLKSTANCGYVQSSNGYDIIFSDASQTTGLDHEIEKYDSASGELVAWVRIPTLSVENDTTIYVHFGHSGVCGATENPTAVWDSNYVGVYHLKETPGVDSYAYDSTTNDNDASFLADVTSGDQVAGKIGGALDFDGTSNDRLRADDDPSLGDMNSLTVETWVKLKELPSTESYFLSYKSHNSNPWFSWQFMAPDWDSSFYFEVRPYTSAHTWTSPSLGTWYHVVGVYPHDQQAQIYVNGVNDTKYPGGTPTGNIIDSDSYYYMGGWNLKGVLDEFRVSSTARSADWIQTSYNNQSDPASFYSVGVSSCFLGGFSCNRKITIPGDNVSGSGNLTDFPVLIKIENDCNLKTSANGGHIQGGNGYDIIFTDASGATQLDHEIEEYDGVRGDLTAWVKIPTLYGSSDTDIYMYYGKSGLTCDPSNPAGVWDGNYKSVWHLEEDPAGTAPQMRDSTSNGNHGTSRGFMITGDQVSGKIGGSLDFDGNNDYVSTTNSFNNPQNFTVSSWFKTGSASGKRVVGFESYQTGEYSGSWDRHIYVGTDGKVYFGSYSGSTEVAVSDNTLNDDSWHYAVGVRDDSTDYIRLYIDGNLNDSTYNSAAENYTGRWRIGSYKTSGWPNGQDGYFPGVIDEVRLSNTVRSADWIKTEYDNQRDPTSFSIMGNDSCGGQYGFNYQYCKKITVDHTQVNSDLTNFPLLVNITGDDDLKTVANGGRVEHNLGYDIVFKSPSCGQLDHEIEKYDGDAGDLIAWVRVPTLSGDTDTEIYMYYGDSGVTCSPENPPGVWDSDYRAVWHLHDDLEDSTSNNNEGTGNGTSNETGKIADAESFDGSDDYISVADNSSLDVTSGLTMEAWVRLSNAGNNQKIVGKVNSTYTRGYLIGVQSGQYPEIWNNQGANHVFTSGSISSYQWAHLATTWTTGGNMIGYINGSQVNSISAGSYDIGTNSDALIIGAAPWNPSTFEVNGRIDEVRVSATARSADWIMTEYKNQNDPGNFYTISSCFEQTTQTTEAWEEDF